MVKILFPTDFSPTANNAFIYALQLANALNAKIVVLYVATHLNDKEMNDLLLCEYRNEKMSLLKNLAHDADLTHIPFEFIYEKGDLLFAILENAKTERMDYIVMGTNGENSLGRKFFGSNTMNVINNALIPVLVIPNAIMYNPNRNFGFATKFEEEEQQALDQMLLVTSRYNKKLYIGHVENKLMTNEMVRVHTEWKNKYRADQIEINLIQSEDVEMGLIKFCMQKEIDTLGIVRRELTYFERMFTLNHSKRMLSHGTVPLLIFPQYNVASNE